MANEKEANKLNDTATDSLRETIRSKTSDELVRLWNTDGKETWTYETLDIVRKMFQQRGDPMPPDLEYCSGIARLHVLLAEIKDMIASGQFSRKPPIELQEMTAVTMPELLPLAREVRELVHDLDNREPNVSVAELKKSVEELEQKMADNE